MKSKCLVAFLLIFNIQFVWASPMCPLPFFTPTNYFGHAFGGAEALTEYRHARSGEDYVFEYIEYQTSDPVYKSVYLVDILSSEDGSYRVNLGRLAKKAPAGATDAPEFTYRAIDIAISNRLVKAVTPILLRTHYSPVPQEFGCVDGFVIQVLLESPGYGDLVADAYNPSDESEAGSVVNLGRALKKFVLGQVEESAVDAALTDVESHSKHGVDAK